MAAQRLSMGRTVHIRIGGTSEKPILRPMTVTRVWDDGVCNGILFTDSNNDRQQLAELGWCEPHGTGPGGRDVDVPHTVWVTSVHEGDGVGFFRWPILLPGPRAFVPPVPDAARDEAAKPQLSVLPPDDPARTDPENQPFQGDPAPAESIPAVDVRPPEAPHAEAPREEMTTASLGEELPPADDLPPVAI